MESEDVDFKEMAAKIMMEAERRMARRDATQQAVERVVGRAGRFNEDDVPNFLEAYNGEMDARGVEDASRLEYFCQVVAGPIYAQVKELRNAHGSWESFEGALLEACGYGKPEGRSRREFDRWVASARRHRNGMDAFREFEHRFSQLSWWERRSVGADKVLLFLKTVHHEARADILFELQDEDGGHGLTEDWSEVEWVCRQHDASRSATERPESGGEEKAVSWYALPPEESSTQAGSEELDFEELVREVCELVTAQYEAEEGSIAESGLSGSRDAED
jgi:hypothetical protein